MKTARTSPLPELVAMTKKRIPNLLSENFVRFLFEIAYADGTIDPREHTAIKEFARHLGITEHSWQRLVASPLPRPLMV